MAKRKISGRVRQRLNKQLQPWNDHVKELQHELNKTKPDTEFKEVLKLAKKTYADVKNCWGYFKPSFKPKLAAPKN